MARNTAADSARRLLALLGHLTPGMSVPIDGLAEALGTTSAQLADDLSTLCLCGVSPYMPDQMIDVFVEDGMVEVYSPVPAVSAPVRLAPGEAGALAAALAAAGFTASDHLVQRLLDASAANFDAESLEHTLRSTIATHDGMTFERLAAAISSHDVVSISYQRGGAEAPSVREVEPLMLFADRGAWYLSAWCRMAEGLRTFRIDRIRSAEDTGEQFDPGVHGRSVRAEATAFAPEGLPVAHVRFAPGEDFIEREWPGGRVASVADDGSTLAEIPFGGTSWIARRVAARLGRVEVLAPADVREAVAAVARAELVGLGGTG